MALWSRFRSSFPPRSARSRGSRAELAALIYLRLKGLRLICRNYRVRSGEIDLIMRDGDECVFIEVRLRSRDDFGTGADSIDQAKRRRLVSAARHFIAQRPDLASHPCRFDVVSIAKRNYRRQYSWIRDAFRL